MIAYERMLESKREDRLFNDHLAEHFVGVRGKQVSECLNHILGMHMKIPNIHLGFTPARTMLINDHLDKWVNATAEKGQKMQVACLGCGVDTRAYWV